MTPKILRLCPGCQQRRLQMNPAPCEMCGRENPGEAPRPREKMHISAKILRALLRPLGWSAHGLTVVFCGFAIWALALHQVLPFFSVVEIGLTLSWALAAGTWAVRLATSALVWQFAPATRQNKRPGARTFLILPVCLAVLAVLNHFDAPLRAAFWISKPGLERATLTLKPAPNGAASSGFWPSRRAGLYRMQRLDIRRRGTRIEVTDSSFIWSGTKAGFAKCPQGCAAAKFPPTRLHSHQAPKYIQLSRDWFWWEESGTDD